MRIINPLFTLVLATPAHGLLSTRLMQLSFIGRRSGKRYSLPVGYVQTNGTVLVTTNSGWRHNLHDDAPVGLRLRGQQRTGRANVITDDEGLRAAFTTLVKAAPQLGEITGVALGDDGQARPDQVAAARQRGFVVITIQLD
jgi:hypothetical protein